MDRLAQSKINVIRRYYIKGVLKSARIARELHIQRDTVYKYFQAFREIERLYPHKLKDFTFLIPRPKPLKLPFYTEMIAVLPELVDHYAATGTLEILNLWPNRTPALSPIKVPPQTAPGFSFRGIG